MILNGAKLVACIHHQKKVVIAPSLLLMREGQFPNGNLKEKRQCKLGQWLLLPYSPCALLLIILPFEEGKHLPYVSAYNFKFKQRALGPSVEAASDIWGTVKQQGQLGQGPVSSPLSTDSTLSQGSLGIQ